MTAACKVKQNILTGKYDINKLLQLKRAQSEMTYTSEKWLRFCASPVMCVHTSSVLPPPPVFTEAVGIPQRCLHFINEAFHPLVPLRRL